MSRQVNSPSVLQLLSCRCCLRESGLGRCGCLRRRGTPRTPRRDGHLGESWQFALLCPVAFGWLGFLFVYALSAWGAICDDYPCGERCVDCSRRCPVNICPNQWYVVGFLVPAVCSLPLWSWVGWASTFQRPAWRLHTLLADGKTALFQQCVARLNEEELDELMGQPERGETPLTVLFREKDACYEEIRLMFTLYPRYATLRDSAGMNMLHSYILHVPGFVDERVVRLLVGLGVDVTAKIAQPSNSRATAQEREREELSIGLSLLSCPGYKNGDSASEALLRRGSVSQIFGGWDPSVACLRTNGLEHLLGVLRELGAPLDHYSRARDIITNMSDADDALKRRLYALYPTPQEVQQRECAAEHGVAAAELTRFTLIVMPNGAVPAPCVGPSGFVYHRSDYDSDYSKKTGEAFRTHISAHDLTSLKEQLLKSLRSYCSHHESYSGTGFAPTTAATLQLMGAAKADSLVIADLKALKQAAAGNWQNGIRIFASASDSDDGVQIQRRASTPPKTAIAVPLALEGVQEQKEAEAALLLAEEL